MDTLFLKPEDLAKFFDEARVKKIDNLYRYFVVLKLPGGDKRHRRFPTRYIRALEKYLLVEGRTLTEEAARLFAQHGSAQELARSEIKSIKDRLKREAKDGKLTTAQLKTALHLGENTIGSWHKKGYLQVTPVYKKPSLVALGDLWRACDWQMPERR